jgi:hypothetical protein|tara:strand:- start:122 stop:673 length:552 start_codon:yes stop_codon:yes gene_type:complete
MNLVKFKEDILKELRIRELGKGDTPILDRLQIHLNNLEGECSVDSMLQKTNMDVEFYASMVYQIVYPAKKIQKFSIEVDGKLLKEEKNPKQTGVALLRELGVNILKSHPKYGKFIFESKEDFMKKYSNNVTLLEMDGFHVSVLHILYSKGNNTLDKITNFIESINEYLQYKKIKIYDNSYYQL